MKPVVKNGERKQTIIQLSPAAVGMKMAFKSAGKVRQRGLKRLMFAPRAPPFANRLARAEHNIVGKVASSRA